MFPPNNILWRLTRIASLLLAFTTATASACPFCTALQPTLSQRRDAAAVVALAEFESTAKGQATVRLHQVLKGKDRLTDRERLSIATEESLRPGALMLLFAEDSTASAGGPLNWRLERTDETGYAYFAKAPPLRAPVAERLAYFARYLEHPSPLVAEDAFNEFGHAPYDQAVPAAKQLSSEKLQAWLADPRVPAGRKGFYGLALGLAGDEPQRAKNLEFLRAQVVQPADDFRAGFDGILGGYLVAGGEPALATLEERFLANPQAADGDLRHTVAALRFYWEFGKDIPPARLRSAMRRLLARPEFAADAVVDLARWQDWDAVDAIAALYSPSASPPAATRRAIVGYLLACPDKRAADALARLRRQDPAGIKQAEQQLSLPGGSGDKDR